MILSLLRDNPFLVRDLRRKRVHTSSPLWRGLIFVCLIGLLESISLLASLASATSVSRLPELHWPSFPFICGLHALGCLWTGTALAMFVLHREVQDGAFWAVQLVPLTPRRMLWLKLWLPVMGTALVWAAGVPNILLAILLELTNGTQALLGLAIAAWAGGMGVPLTILGFEFSAKGTAAEEKPVAGTNEALRGLSTIALWIGMAWVALLLIANPERMPFFGFRVPAWPAACVLLTLAWSSAIVFGVQSFGGAAGTYSGSALIVSVPLTVVTLGGIGAAWGRLPWQVAGLMALVVAIGVLAWRRQGRVGSKATGRKREDPWSTSELEWISTRFDNPLLLRDLRAATRLRSLRRSWLSQLFTVPVLAVVLYVLVVKLSMGFGPFAWILNGTFITGLGNLASGNWGKERANGTLELLKLCPQSARELLLGRMVASFVHAAPIVLPVFILVLAVLGWLILQGFWFAGPLALAFLPLIGVSSVWSACHVSTPNMSPSQSHVILRGVTMAGIPLGAAAIFALYRVGPLPGYLLAVTLGGFNGWFATRVFWEYARRFEASRTIDFEPASG